jgi:lactate dehydrogenase-like 2-hydroxyacid dehydrogenase
LVLTAWKKSRIIGTGKIGGAFAKKCMVLVAKFWPVIQRKIRN